VAVVSVDRQQVHIAVVLEPLEQVAVVVAVAVRQVRLQQVEAGAAQAAKVLLY
jgi:hypothetical protein